MAMTDAAFSGLRAAVESNPFGARTLLSILRETPAWVKRKEDDPFGPIHLILNEVERMIWDERGQIVPVAREPFPEAMLPACATFGEEWLGRRFSKAELAAAIAAILAAGNEQGKGAT